MRIEEVLEGVPAGALAPYDALRVPNTARSVAREVSIGALVDTLNRASEGRFTVSVHAPGMPVISTALHAAHEIRENLRSAMKISPRARFVEEDPFTDSIVDFGGVSIVAHHSRFEVDLNRAPAKAVYVTPADAWGLETWHDEGLSSTLLRETHEHYARFYGHMAELLSTMLYHHKTVLLLDIHSYNRRAGVADELQPEICVGTGNVNTQRWGDAIEQFSASFAAAAKESFERTLVIKENTPFRGGTFTQWANRQFDDAVLAIQIEIRKDLFMDEEQGILKGDALQRLRVALGKAALDFR